MSEELGLENIGNQPEEKRFTQSELNKFLADERRKTEKKYTARAKDMQLTHDLERAATRSDAMSASVLTNVLKTMSKVVEKQDETGSGTGIYETFIELNELDEDDNPVVVRLSPEKAVKRMKELPEFMGFFKAPGVSGIGGGSSGVQPARQLDPSKLSTEEYMALRNTPAGKKRLGLNNIARR
jgi:hypothetical protein